VHERCQPGVLQLIVAKGAKPIRGVSSDHPRTKLYEIGQVAGLLVVMGQRPNRNYCGQIGTTEVVPSKFLVVSER